MKLPRLTPKRRIPEPGSLAAALTWWRIADPQPPTEPLANPQPPAQPPTEPPAQPPTEPPTIPLPPREWFTEQVGGGGADNNM